MKRFVAISLLAACGITGTDEGGLGTPENPVPVDRGAYDVTSTIDFTVEAILPPQAELVVATLRDFSKNPAHALISIADKTGLPALGTLYSVVPGPLKDKLEGWINGEISKVSIAGKPVTAWAGQMAALADTALTKFAVDSTLELDGDNATHTLVALDFAPAGIDKSLPIVGLAQDVLTTHPTLFVAEAGAVTFGDQHFGLQFGEYAWQIINEQCTAQFGHDLRTTIGNAINCPGLAQAVSSKCVLGVCVGHKSEIEAVCEGGLDLVVGQVHKELAKLNIDVFHYASGSAPLVDDDQDGIADRIVDGVWDAEMNLGLGLRHTPATFTGAR